MASSSLRALIGSTPDMRALLERVTAVAHGDLVLRGEDGTGRQTLARALHDEARTGKPFVVVDLAATPPQLLESTLFGYEVSAFVGGLKVTRGAFESAESGTVVLREIAAIPRELQARLAGTLRTRSYVRVGARAERPLRARLISTTGADLEELVAAGQFDPALHRALSSHGVFVIPPLRDRLADLPALAERFAKRALAPAQLARLAALPWTGNVRELERAVAAIIETARPDAIIELELLAAIAADPADDAPRLVYADLLADRGDPRGELIQVQCRLARAAGETGETRRWRAAERQLIEAHGAAWTASAIEVAHDSSSTATATLRRGFVEAIRAPVDVLHRLDRLFECAPALDELDLVGVPGPHHLVSPRLRRLRALSVQLTADVPDPAPMPELQLIASCPHLSGLRSLTVEPAGERSGAASSETIAALARSPHVATLRSLTLINVSIWGEALAALLDESARWQLTHLALRRCGIDVSAVERLISSPRIRGVRALDLEGNPLGAAGVMQLAAESLSSLEILRIANVGADWDQVSPGPLTALRESRALANTAIYVGGRLLER
jgi:uncharacterized protein (TIGR02996 family)